MFDRWLEVDAKFKPNARKNSEQKKSKSKFQAISQKVTSENPQKFVHHENVISFDLGRTIMYEWFKAIKVIRVVKMKIDYYGLIFLIH